MRDPRRIATGLTDHQAMFFRSPELLDQHLLRDVRKVSLQFAGALGAVQMYVVDHGFPASGYHAETPLNGQTGKSFHYVRHEHTTKCVV